MSYKKPKYFISLFETVWWRVPYFVYEWASKQGTLATKYTRYY